MYLVSGGCCFVSTTEILTEGASKWMKVGSLPMGLRGPRIASVQNNIILTGGLSMQKLLF